MEGYRDIATYKRSLLPKKWITSIRFLNKFFWKLLILWSGFPFYYFMKFTNCLRVQGRVEYFIPKF